MCFTSSRVNPDPLYYCCHDSLCLDEYTHFTSPMRRYVDIEVQRMLLEHFKTPALRVEFQHDINSKLCSALNTKGRNARDFERGVKKVELGFKYISSSETYTAFIGQAIKGTIQLAFPQLELNHFPPDGKKIRIANLLPSKNVKLSDGTSQYKWKLHITSLKGDMAADILKSSFLSLSRSNAGAHSSDDSGDVLEVFCSDDSTTLDREYFKSSHQKSVVTLSRSLWLEVLKFIKNPSKDMADIRKIMPQLPSLPSASTAVDIDSTKKYPFRGLFSRALPSIPGWSRLVL